MILSYEVRISQIHLGWVWGLFVGNMNVEVVEFCSFEAQSTCRFVAESISGMMVMAAFKLSAYLMMSLTLEDQQ